MRVSEAQELVVMCVTFRPLNLFFFQAEDGIRDKLVTGVQTCALPICPPCRCVRALRGRARPGVRPYRTHCAPSPGSQPGDNALPPELCSMIVRLYRILQRTKG